MLNSPTLVTSGDAVNTSGVIKITGLPAFLKTDLISITRTAANAETVQTVKIGETTVPTIAASTKYQLKLGVTGNRIEGGQSNLKAYGYTAPAVLTGTAATDRFNAYTSLAYKINNDPTNKVAAQNVVTLAQTTNGAAYAAGEIITGTTTGAKGVVLAGTTANLTVNVTNGISFVGETAATGSITGVTTTMGAVTLGVGLRIVDDGAYYDVENINNGATTVLPTLGFVAANVVISTAAIYANGQGADLIKMMYAQEKTSENRAAGVHEFPTNSAPISGKSYSRYTILVRPNASSQAISDSIAKQEFRYILWVDEGISTATTFANLNTSILAL